MDLKYMIVGAVEYGYPQHQGKIVDIVDVGLCEADEGEPEFPGGYKVFETTPVTRSDDGHVISWRIECFVQLPEAEPEAEDMPVAIPAPSPAKERLVCA